MSNLSFHFTLGPVQGFISQARRTRDFWAGSFLLSWLSGVAMLAVEEQGGEIEFPRPAQGYLNWIKGQGIGTPPRQGAIPNRFKASVPTDFNAKKVENTVKEAWMTMADHIWERDLKDVANPQTRAIWERQHAGFWEINWILAEIDASDLLDRRKNWRSHFVPDEPGVKCMVMDGWQELSGAERPNSKSQKEFWQRVRTQRGRVGMQTDLPDGEKLCALAFVKRRFARHFHSFSKEVQGVPLRGWKLDSGVPSVAYLAAVHWLEKVLCQPDKDAVEELLDAAVQLDFEASDGMDPSRHEWDTRIRCLENANSVNHNFPRWMLSRDGHIFFATREESSTFAEYPAEVSRLRSAIKALKLDEPLSPFYAILLMDGDSLGVFMGDSAKQPLIADALNRFTEAVPPIVADHNGFLIYAGGDDVLAILPLEDALPCAKELHSVYEKVFEGSGISSTLSGAIEFAHIKMPLGQVLGDSHHLLDEIAKDGCGRDAIAVRVWKPGGCNLQWAQPWRVAVEDDALVLNRLKNQLNERAYSNAFLYRIRERFAMLNPDSRQRTAALSEDDEVAILAADYLSSGQREQDATSALTPGEARAFVSPLLQQCRPQHRVPDVQTGELECVSKQPRRLEADGALLVRFLASKGVEARGGGR